MELASLRQRFVGALVDGLISLAPYMMLRESKENPPVMLAGLGLLIAVFAAQCWFLARDGQTLGKKVAKTRVVRADTGENGGFVTNVLLRAILSSLPNALPFYWIVDTLFVFRKDRRCVHDFIARTKVVTVAPASSAA